MPRNNSKSRKAQRKIVANLNVEKNRLVAEQDYQNDPFWQAMDNMDWELAESILINNYLLEMEN